MQETLGSHGSTSGNAKECVAGTEAWGAEGWAGGGTDEADGADEGGRGEA